MGAASMGNAGRSRLVAATFLAIAVASVWIVFLRSEDEMEITRGNGVVNESRSDGPTSAVVSVAALDIPTRTTSPTEFLLVHVVDEGGDDIPDATVSIVAPTALCVSAATRLIPLSLTGADGRCLVPRSADVDEPACVHAIAPGYIAASQAFAHDTSDATLVLRASSTPVTVRLESTEGSIPEEATVTLSRCGVIPDVVRDDASVDVSPLVACENAVHRCAVVNGRATFRSLEEGSWVITVDSPRWQVAPWIDVPKVAAPGPEVVVPVVEPVVEFVEVVGDVLLGSRCMGKHEKHYPVGSRLRSAVHSDVSYSLRDRWPNARVEVDLPMPPLEDPPTPHRVELFLARAGLHIVEVTPTPISSLGEPFVFDASVLETTPTGELVVDARDADGSPTRYDDFVLRGKVTLSGVDGASIARGEPITLPVGSYRLDASRTLGGKLFEPVSIVIADGERTRVTVTLTTAVRRLVVRLITDGGSVVSQSGIVMIRQLEGGNTRMDFRQPRTAPRAIWLPCEMPLVINGRLPDGRSCEETISMPVGSGEFEVPLTLR